MAPPITIVTLRDNLKNGILSILRIFLTEKKEIGLGYLSQEVICLPIFVVKSFVEGARSNCADS
jgi:hypothetical protein